MEECQYLQEILISDSEFKESWDALINIRDALKGRNVIFLCDYLCIDDVKKIDMILLYETLYGHNAFVYLRAAVSFFEEILNSDEDIFDMTKTLAIMKKFCSQFRYLDIEQNRFKLSCHLGFSRPVKEF